MKKKIVVAAALSSVGVIAHAQSSVTLYGLIDAGVSYVSHAATSTGHGQLFKYGDGVAQGSRWGLRGVEDLGGGLQALFTLESGFSSGDGTLGQGGALFGRQAYVGIAKKGLGSVTLGRQYSFSTDYLGGNYTMGGQTPAGNYAYHINDLDQLTASRINNAVKFSSANFSGLTFGAMYGFSNQAGSFAGSPTTSAGGTRALANKQGQHPRGVTGRGQRPHLQGAERERLASLHRGCGDPVRQQLELQRVDQHLELRPALAQHGNLADVVEVVMGQQHVRRLQPEPLGRRDQPLHRPAGVDEERGAADAVGDEVRVGQELGMARVLDDHRGSSSHEGP